MNPKELLVIFPLCNQGSSTFKSSGSELSSKVHGAFAHLSIVVVENDKLVKQFVNLK